MTPEPPLASPGVPILQWVGGGASRVSPHTPPSLPPLIFSVLGFDSDSGRGWRVGDRTPRLSVSLRRRGGLGKETRRRGKAWPAVGSAARSLPAGVPDLSSVLQAHCCGLVTGEMKGQ